MSLPRKLLEPLRALADEEDRSLAWIIRQLLREGLEARARRR